MDPFLFDVALVGLIVLAVKLLFRWLRQPSPIGYILVGVAIGPFGSSLFTDSESLARLGSLGVLFLLFFIGMEISIPKLIRNWRVPILGTALQILASVAATALLGWWLSWPMSRVILLGFVISLSSTGVVLKLLQDWRQLDSRIGQDVLGVLIAQDIALIPMLIIIGLLGGEGPHVTEVALQLTGGALMIVILVAVFKKGEFRLPFSEWIDADHELQVLAALSICLTLSVLTSLFHLSAALGAFLGGVVVSATRETAWVRSSLEPFRVVFLGTFFLSIGMLIDLGFLSDNYPTILLLLAAILITNTFVSAGILLALRTSWRESVYAGAMLSQIGEFSFLLATVGLQMGIIVDFAYQATVLVIALSLLVSPVWIGLLTGICGKPGPND